MNAPILFLALSLSAPQEPRAGFDTVPLQHLLRPADAAAPLPRTTMLEVADRDALLARSAPLDAGTLLDPLRVLHGPALEAGTLRWHVAGGNLLLAGDAAAVAACRTHMQSIARMLTRPVQIELAIWDATDRSSPACVLDGAAFAEFSKDRQPWLRLVDTVGVDQIATLSRLRKQSYVRSVAGEVAQKAFINDPMLAEYRDGAIALAKVQPLVGSDELVVHAQFALAQRRGIPRAMQTGTASAPDVEVPTLETCMGTLSGRIPNGGALAVVLRGHPALGGQIVVTLRVTASAVVTPAADKGFTVVPVGALTEMSLLPVGPSPERPDREPQSCGFVPMDQLFDLANAAGGDGQATVAAIGSHLLLTGDAKAIGNIVNLVRSLQDRLLRTTTLVATGSVPGSNEPNAERTANLYEIAAPTLIGRSLHLARLLETNALTDVEVEIAQEASMAVPIVTALQAGTWIQATTTLVDSAAHVDLRLRCTHAATPQARSIMPNGVLTPTDQTTSQVEHRGLVVNGLPIEHGDGPMLPVEGRSWRSVLQTVVRW